MNSAAAPDEGTQLVHAGGVRATPCEAAARLHRWRCTRGRRASVPAATRHEASALVEMAQVPALDLRDQMNVCRASGTAGFAARQGRTGQATRGQPCRRPAQPRTAPTQRTVGQTRHVRRRGPVSRHSWRPRRTPSCCFMWRIYGASWRCRNQPDSLAGHGHAASSPIPLDSDPCLRSHRRSDGRCAGRLGVPLAYRLARLAPGSPRAAAVASSASAARRWHIYRDRLGTAGDIFKNVSPSSSAASPPPPPTAAASRFPSPPWPPMNPETSGSWCS